MINQTQVIIIVFLLFIITIIFIFIDDFHDIFIGATKKLRISLKIKKFCKNNDLIFLANLSLSSEQENIVFDQIIIANKFIYVITDRIWLGDLTGLAIDDKWLLYSGNNLTHVQNPLSNAEKNITYLMNFLRSEREDFVNVILIAKTVQLDEINTDSNQKVISERDLFKWIKSNEKTRIDSFTDESIEESANNLMSLHLRNKKFRKNRKLL